MASGCDPCNSSGGSSYLPPQNSCTPKTTGGPVDSSCVLYTGPNLTCIGADSNTWLENILQLIDTKVCESGGDAWSTYNYNCLTGITTAGQFADAITLAYCNLNTAYNTFITTTYPTGIGNLQTQINQITNPSLTLCAGTGITSSDTYTSILSKLASSICNIQAAINVSGANWNQCFSTTPLPTTITQGFNIVLDKLCTIINNPTQTVLPTFNNQGSCLAAPLGTADSLVLTINKIKDKLCTLGSYDINMSPWGCVVNPAPGTGANVQSAINALVTATNTLKGNDVTFDAGDFTIAFNTPGNPCSGRLVSLSNAVSSDRFVASTSSDMSPGTLSDKLTAGTSITLDNTTTPGQIIINADPGTDQLVKSRSADPAAGYLENKVQGIDNSPKGISIITTTNTGSNKVEFTPDFNDFNHVSYIFDTIENDPVLYARFCSLICGCEPCNGTTTTTVPTRGRVSLRVENVTGETINLNVKLNQNSPSLGLVNVNINLTPSMLYNSGFYDLSSPFLPFLTTLFLDDLDGATYNFTAAVIYPNSTSVPGSSTASGAIDPPYTNSSFSLGSTYSDVILLIRILS